MDNNYNCHVCWKQAEFLPPTRYITEGRLIKCKNKHCKNGIYYQELKDWKTQDKFSSCPVCGAVPEHWHGFDVYVAGCVQSANCFTVSSKNGIDGALEEWNKMIAKYARNVEPKPDSCPLCGSENVNVIKNQGMHYVECGKCLVIGPRRFYLEDAVDAWNNDCHELNQVIAAKKRKLQRLREILKTNNVEESNGQ